MSLKPIEKIKKVESEDHLSWTVSEGNIVDKINELIEVVNEQMKLNTLLFTVCEFLFRKARIDSTDDVHEFEELRKKINSL